ncbi:MAG TPA: DEAD/DEAH box helicase, partial [Micromonosporaceae bacterium]
MTAVRSGPAELLDQLARGRRGSLVHVRQVPPRDGQTADWPGWVPEVLRFELALRGIDLPWRHQVEAANAIRAGEHVVIATGTGSGKSLAYQLPVLTHLLDHPRTTALYLSPTKALAADQLRSVTDLRLPTVRPSGYDGDTPAEEREWIRTHARLIFTNPDMLHRSILPRHSQWHAFLRRLSFVVIDECHTYRGVFGSHVAQVIRRLRRVLDRYARRPPVFVLASATAAEPAIAANRLTGLPVRAVTEDTSPRGGVTFGLWEPPLLRRAALGAAGAAGTSGPVGANAAVAATGAPATPDGDPIRRSVLMETADLLVDAVTSGRRTLAFVR